MIRNKKLWKYAGFCITCEIGIKSFKDERNMIYFKDKIGKLQKKITLLLPALMLA